MKALLLTSLFVILIGCSLPTETSNIDNGSIFDNLITITASDTIQIKDSILVDGEWKYEFRDSIITKEFEGIQGSGGAPDTIIDIWNRRRNLYLADVSINPRQIYDYILNTQEFRSYDTIDHPRIIDSLTSFSINLYDYAHYTNVGFYGITYSLNPVAATPFIMDSIVLNTDNYLHPNDTCMRISTSFKHYYVNKLYDTIDSRPMSEFYSDDFEKTLISESYEPQEGVEPFWDCVIKRYEKISTTLFFYKDIIQYEYGVLNQLFPPQKKEIK